jgi:hypothetical protein
MTTTDAPPPWAGFLESGNERPLITGIPAIDEVQAMLRSAEREEERARQRAREERAEARENLMLAKSHQYAAQAGEPFDHANPYKHWPAPGQLVAQAFAQQDRESHRQDVEALRKAGLGHLVGQLSPADMSPGQSPPPSSGSAPAAAGAATRAHPLGTRIRAAFDRWAHRATTPTRTDDGSRDLNEPRYITRSTHQYQR